VRVLVVDDTEHVRNMLVEMLSLDGFEVVGHAGDGPSAVDAATRNDPDVIVMDLRMPGQDGLETTRMIRAERPHQMVVLYTAYLDARIRDAAAAAGAQLCLDKTAGLLELERELSRLRYELTGDSPNAPDS
jgi:DNA-binding NarL/FixJ family response regulator